MNLYTVRPSRRRKDPIVETVRRRGRLLPFFYEEWIHEYSRWAVRLLDNHSRGPLRPSLRVSSATASHVHLKHSRIVSDRLGKSHAADATLARAAQWRRENPDLAVRQAEFFHSLWDDPGGAVAKEELLALGLSPDYRHECGICDRDYMLRRGCPCCRD